MPTSADELAHSVFRYGLALKARLDRGETPDLDAEQTALKEMLLSDYDARRWPEFGGESIRERGTLTNSKDASADRGQFLGIRYALVCWLDELFTCYSPWASAWNEHKLEVELYGSNDRAWRFWEQARLAQARPGGESLEAFFLCVTLGFRGELREQPEKLQTWINHAKTRLANVREPVFPLASIGEPPTRVPPLRGREQLQRMVLCSWLVLLATIPVAAYCLISQ